MIAKVPLTITKFDVHLNLTDTREIRVYMKNGGYQESDQTPSDWTRIQTANVQGQNLGNLTPLPNLPTPVPVQPGSPVSFYITSTTSNMRYTNGATGSEGTAYASNPHLDICVGAGKQHEFGSTYTPRIWNGQITYSLDSDTSPTPEPTPSKLFVIL